MADFGRDKFGRDAELLRSLPAAKPSGKVEAYLTWNETGTGTGTASTLRYWRFLYPIQQLEYQTTISYATSATVGTNSQDLYWLSNQPQTLTLPDLILNTYWDKKSIRPILEAIDQLCKASKERRSPPVLTFTCGNIRFSPCVLTGDVTYRITQMVGGEPVEASLDLQLTKVEAGQLILPTAPPIPTAPPLIVLPSLVIPAAPAPTVPGTTPTIPGGTTPTAPSFTGDVKNGVLYLGGCTAFVVANQGADCIIATAGHCINNNSATATINGKTFRCQALEVSGSSAKDVAIIKAANYNHPTVLRLMENTSGLKKGDAVYAWGHIGGDNNLEYSGGTIVSNPIAEGESEFHQGTPGAYIRYSARFLGPGDSGGPQFDKATNLVISVTHGGAGATSQGKDRGSEKYPVSDNKPTGSKIENVIEMLKKRNIPYNTQ